MGSGEFVEGVEVGSNIAEVINQAACCCLIACIQAARCSGLNAGQLLGAPLPLPWAGLLLA